MVLYITNELGRKTAVVVPIEEWDAIQAELRKNDQLESLRRSYREMQKMETSGTKGGNWESFLKSLDDE